MPVVSYKTPWNIEMSKEIQDRAERMIRELKESLVPIKEEIQILKKSSEETK